MATRIQLRRDTAAQWTANNPTLSTGEAGYEADTGKLKIGNGSSAWSSLSYISEPIPSQTSNSGKYLTTNGTALSWGTVDLSSKADLASPTFTGTVNAAELILSGNLTVNGTTTTINSTTLSVDDKNIELGSVENPTDTTADGGGITLKGATDKTFNWVDATDSWTSSEHIDLANGKVVKINGVQVLSATEFTGNAATVTNGVVTTGSYSDPSWIVSLAASKVSLGNVENVALSTWAGSSNITTLGTISTGTWSATNIALDKGGTNAALTAANGGVVYSTASALAITSVGSSGQVLTSNGAAAPTWETISSGGESFHPFMLSGM
jgi:hypothetical protein